MWEELNKALRDRDPAILRSELVRVLVEGESEWLKDWRDLLVALAPFHDCARRLGLEPAAVFDEAALAGPSSLADVVRSFGRRTDVNSRSFHYDLVETAAGPRYMRTDGVA